MKHLLVALICTQFICCTTVTETLPDGTVRVTKGMDAAAFSLVAGAAQNIVVTATK